MFESGHICDESGKFLFPWALKPVGYFARLRGLILRAPLNPAEAWWFERCNAIHTCWMRHAIDVLHLSDQGDVLLIDAELEPWRISACKGGARVVELAAGRAAQLDLQVGSQLRFCT